MRHSKIISAALLIVMMLSFFGAYSVFAIDNITVRVDGKALTFDQAPMTINYRTMVPLRTIFETLGAKVAWIDSAQTVMAVKDNKTITLKVGEPAGYIDNIGKPLDAPAVLINGRTLVPVRFVAEALNCTVDWDETTRTVIILTAASTPVITPSPIATAAPQPTFVPSGPARTEKVECVADTFVRDGENADKNFGTSDQIEYKATKDKGYQRKAFIRFDASKIADANVTSAKIKLYVKNTEKSDESIKVFAYETNGSWDENSVTFNTAPKEGTQIGEGGFKGGKIYHEIDITQYVRQKLSSGSKIIDVVLYDAKLGNRRLDFDSREAGNKPYLELTYGSSSNNTGVVAPVMPSPAASAAPSTAPAQSTGKSAELSCIADTNIRGGADNENKNFGTNKMLDYKATKDAAYLRKVYLTFDASSLSAKSVSSAKVRLYLTDAEDSSATVNVMAFESAAFEESSITFKTAPQAGKQIGSAKINGIKKWQEIDITDYVNSKLASGETKISIVLADTTNSNKRLMFDSKETDNKPVLKVEF